MTEPSVRERLLQVARRRFAADGTLAATLDEIRRDAGVSVGALYHHFGDKGALAAAVYAQVMAEYQAGFVAALRAQGTAEGGIRAAVIYHLRWVAVSRSEAVVLFGERLDSPALQECNQDFFAAVSDWWRPHHNYGAVQAMRPGITSALWLGPAQEYTRYWLASGERTMPRAAVATFADAAWEALRAKDVRDVRDVAVGDVAVRDVKEKRR